MKEPMTAGLPFQDQENAPLVWSALKFAAVLGLHVALGTAVFYTQFSVPIEPAPIRLDVRTIAPPLPTPPAVIKPVSEAPKSLPQTIRPVVRRVEPPSLLTAAPSANPAPATFAAPPQPAKTESPVAAVPTPAPVAVSGARFDAAYLQNPVPAFPAMSRKLREEGKVLLLVHVTATGLAEQVEIKQGSGYPRLDDAALNAVRQWRFVPARRGDEAVAGTVVVPIIFRLASE